VLSRAFAVPLEGADRSDPSESTERRGQLSQVFSPYICRSYSSVAGVRLRVQVSTVDACGQERFALRFSLMWSRPGPRRNDG
jgi:hypothetical protein